MPANVFVAVDFDFFVYRNPAWPFSLPIDEPAPADAWKRRVGYLYHSAGQNIRVKSNLVAEVDGARQIQPADFNDLLRAKNALVTPATVLYASDYRKMAYSAVTKVCRDVGPVELIHFGTSHGFREYDARNGSTDATCSDSWHSWVVKDKLVSKVTLVFPEWQRKFVDIDGVGLKDEDIARLPEGHPPIREMFLNDWMGLAEPVTVSGFFGAREGALVPPWLDECYVDFMTQLPGEVVKNISADDPQPNIPRGWSDTPPDAVELGLMKATPKKIIDRADPLGISVLYNSRLVPLR